MNLTAPIIYPHGYMMFKNAASPINAIICVKDYQEHTLFDMQQKLISNFNVKILSMHTSPNKKDTQIFVKINDQNSCIRNPHGFNIQDFRWIEYITLLPENLPTIKNSEEHVNNIIAPYDYDINNNINESINTIICLKNKSDTLNAQKELAKHRIIILSEHLTPAGTVQLFVQLNDKNCLTYTGRTQIQDEEYVEYVALLP